MKWGTMCFVLGNNFRYDIWMKIHVQIHIFRSLLCIIPYFVIVSSIVLYIYNKQLTPNPSPIPHQFSKFKFKIDHFIPRYNYFWGVNLFVILIFNVCLPLMKTMSRMSSARTRAQSIIFRITINISTFLLCRMFSPDFRNLNLDNTFDSVSYQCYGI